MAINIDTDLQRFRRKIEQAKRDGLKRYIETGSQGVITGDGKRLRIPVHRLHLPRFRFKFEEEGVGQGEGEIGDKIIGPWNPNPVDDQISDDEEDGDIPDGKRSRDLCALLSEVSNQRERKCNAPTNEARRVAEGSPLFFLI